MPWVEVGCVGGLRSWVCAVGFFFGSWGLRLWLVVVAVAVAMVRGDELEKLRPWRF